MRWSKILRPDQNNTGRRHPFLLSRERTLGNEPGTNFLLNRMVIPLKNLPKNIALAHSVSFKSKLDLYLNKVGRKTFNRKGLLKVRLIPTCDILITAVYPYYYNYFLKCLSNKKDNFFLDFKFIFDFKISILIKF